MQGARGQYSNRHRVSSKRWGFEVRVPINAGDIYWKFYSNNAWPIRLTGFIGPLTLI